MASVCALLSSAPQAVGQSVSREQAIMQLQLRS